jgi:hypothetical protein
MGVLIKERHKAVLYMRHSREHAQENSIPIQRERAQKWARENNVDIIHEELDSGVSGLTADRPGFQRLWRDWILNAERSFDLVLALDVSRLGRFQDPDEAGHYEFLCRENGRRMWYIDRGPLKLHTEPLHHIQTELERLGAAEHSRKLSDRVWHGSVRVSKEGYSAGGAPCYGMERVLLDEQRQIVCVLKPGEHKQISNQRVTFRPRNDRASATVQDIFRLFTREDFLPKQIADTLNRRRIPSPAGKRWDSAKILCILKNETYIGTRIYNRVWKQLKAKKRRLNPRSEWIICPDAFPPTVQSKTFFAAQKRLRFLLPSLRYRGTRLIHIIERQLIIEMMQFIHETHFSKGPDRDSHTLFPFIFSIRGNRHSSHSQWNFVLPEPFRVFPAVIGVGLALDRHETVERFFFLPTADFGLYNVLAFSEQEARDCGYLIGKEDVQKKLLSLMKQ